MERIRNRSLRAKVTGAREAAAFIVDGMTVGASGFTPSGYPKAVPLALAERAATEPFKINLFTGASVGDELDGALSRAGVINLRLPYQTNNSMRDAINSGSAHFVDMHLSHVPQLVRYGYLGKIDVALVEAVAITEAGHIVPSTSLGATPAYIEQADKVIVEINTSQPSALEGMHDIYRPDAPPRRQPIPLTAPGDRIGTPYIPCGPEKIAAIVITDIADAVRPLGAIDQCSRDISDLLIEFLQFEVQRGRLPRNLLPLQSGVGSVANAVLAGLLRSPFIDLTCYTEVIQDSMLDLIDAGRVTVASGCSLTPSAEGLKRFKHNIDFYRTKIVLRPQDITNHPEIVRRLGVLSINTALEADIYGNVNSTHVCGQRLMNGIGGSGDFARNAYLSIFTTPSVAKNGDISSIVPMVSHHDHTEHDVMVIITEQGVADLRGQSPRQRARQIIEKCAHADYRPMLWDYLARAEAGQYRHTPHLLNEALSWHHRFLHSGSMKP